MSAVSLINDVIEDNLINLRHLEQDKAQFEHRLGYTNAQIAKIQSRIDDLRGAVNIIEAVNVPIPVGPEPS